MKKLLIVFILFLTSVFCYAQAFDDLPYTSSDSATWFQQEISSLLRFQFENDINIPFFVTLSTCVYNMSYKPEYIKKFLNPNYDGSGIISSDMEHASEDDTGFLFGGQFKLSSSFYLPVFVCSSFAHYDCFIYGEWEEYQKNDYVSVRPYQVYRNNVNNFFGTGLNINTDKLKGGIYLGYTMIINQDDRDDLDNSDSDDGGFTKGFKIAIVPLVDTSNMAYIGKVLSSVMGYLGMGNAVMNAKQETGDSEISAFMKTINAGLDFTFNKFNFGPLSLKANAIYLRGNYNLIAKADTFGLKLQGQLSKFPLGFSVEGGYKHFFSISPYMEPYYPDTGYVSASVFFPLKYFTIGTIYQYDGIYESKFIFAISTNFLSGFYCYNPRTNYNKNQFDGAENPFNFGARFRWGGWNVKTNK